MTLSNQRPFRFGVTVSRADSAEGWWAEMRRVEAAGYSTLLVADWLGPVLAPLPALAIAAASTTRLRVGTWALANDFRNPVLVAREAATLDLLTDGRFELGLGAGRADHGYASLGLHPDAGGVRVRRLAESARLTKPLFRGEPVTVTGEHYSISGATLYPPVRHRARSSWP